MPKNSLDNGQTFKANVFPRNEIVELVKKGLSLDK